MKLTKFSLDKGIILKYVDNYYPYGNGLAKHINKNLIHILKKNIVDQQINGIILYRLLYG
jgi:hypothetical protein